MPGEPRRSWPAGISETTAIKKATQARLGFTEAPSERMSEEPIAAIVEALGGSSTC
jgi:hypothetical protein